MAAGLGPNLDTEIGQRPIPEEPMYSKDMFVLLRVFPG